MDPLLANATPVKNLKNLPTQVADLPIYIGGDDLEEGCYHYFYTKEGTTLTIMTDPLLPPEYYESESRSSLHDPGQICNCQNEKMYNIHQEKSKEAVKEIKEMAMARKLDYSESVGIMTSTKKSGNRVFYRPSTSSIKVKGSGWASYVHESEVTVTNIITAQTRLGIWKGKEVDLFIGWNDFWRECAEFEMKAHRLLDGQVDIVYELLAHIVDDNGDVIGLMTEASGTQMVEECDIPLIEEAFVKLNAKNLTLSPQISEMRVDGGRLRFCTVGSTIQIEESKREETLKTQRFRLENVFRELRTSGNRYPAYRVLKQALHIFPHMTTKNSNQSKLPIAELRVYSNKITVTPENAIVPSEWFDEKEKEEKKEKKSRKENSKPRDDRRQRDRILEASSSRPRVWGSSTLEASDVASGVLGSRTSETRDSGLRTMEEFTTGRVHDKQEKRREARHQPYVRMQKGKGKERRFDPKD